MDMRVTFESDFARVAYEGESNAVVTYWKKPVTIESYKETFAQILKTLKENKATSFVSDISHQGIVGTTSRLWMQENILTEAIRNGLRKIGTAVPEDTFKKFYVDQIKNEIRINNKTVEFRYFRYMEEALDWVTGPVLV